MTKKAQRRFETLKHIAENGYYSKKLDGKRLDAVTVNLLLQIEKGLNEENKNLFLELPIERLVKVAYGFVRE